MNGVRELEVQVVADGGQGLDPEEELRSLRRWLAADETLERSVNSAPAGAGPPQPGSLGAAGFDVLELVISSGLSAGALAVAVLQWRDARRGKPSLVLRRGDVEVRIPADGGTDEESVRRIIAMLDEESGRDGQSS